MVEDDVLRPRNCAAQSARVTKKVAAFEDFIDDDSFWNTEMLAVRPECEHRREVEEGERWWLANRSSRTAWRPTFHLRRCAATVDKSRYR